MFSFGVVILSSSDIQLQATATSPTISTDAPTVSITLTPSSLPTFFPSTVPSTLAPTAAPTEKIGMGGDVDPTIPDELTPLQEFLLKNRDVLIVTGVVLTAVILLSALVAIVRRRINRASRRDTQGLRRAESGDALAGDDLPLEHDGTPSL